MFGLPNLDYRTFLFDLLLSNSVHRNHTVATAKTHKFRANQASNLPPTTKPFDNKVIKGARYGPTFAANAANFLASALVA
jgi:hypothetical protein